MELQTPGGAGPARSAMPDEPAPQDVREQFVREDERHRLSRERVVDAAIAYIDRNGLASLSMRRLGRELGVEAMALYRHVNGREDLLEGIVDRVMEEVDGEPGDALSPADGWQAYLQWLAHQVR